MSRRLWAAVSSRDSTRSSVDGAAEDPAHRLRATRFLSHLTTNTFFSNLVRRVSRAGALVLVARRVSCADGY